MLRLNQSKQIIFFFLALFIASSAYLFAIDSRYNDPRFNNNWFALSFIDPKSDNLNFVIENFSTKTNFHWEILADKEKVSQGDVEIRSGEQKELSASEVTNGKKMTVQVSTGDDTQEIYKNITN